MMRHVRVHVGLLIALGLFSVVLMFLMWSILNHRSFQLELHHRGTLEEELPAIVAIGGSSLVAGNAVEIGHNGEFFDRLLADIDGATETVHIETFVWWAGEICDRVARARVMLPSVEATDSAIVQHASHRHFEELLDAGVEIYKYDRTLLHQKVMVVDGLWSTVGSANFDDRSFELNDEIQVGVVDRGIARELEAAFEDDLRFARRLDPAEWKRRGRWHRLKDRLAYVLNEQL